jgi:hypothetical protein
MSKLLSAPWDASFTVGDFAGAVLLNVKDNYAKREHTRELKRARDARLRSR